MSRETIVPAVLVHLEAGLSLRKACEKEGVAESTVRYWINEEEDLSAQYAHARAKLLDYHAHEILTIADDDELKPDDKRVRVDARKWVYSRLMPKRFGDKQQHEHSGGEKPLEKVTRIELIGVEPDGEERKS